MIEKSGTNLQSLEGGGETIEGVVVVLSYY
jgi:hypothetical protein